LAVGGTGWLRRFSRRGGGIEAFSTVSARLRELQGWLELFEYGRADGPIKVPLSVLFPGERG
jgi:hypothetical protein